jgi:hypothetical protein
MLREGEDVAFPTPWDFAGLSALQYLICPARGVGIKNSQVDCVSHEAANVHEANDCRISQPARKRATSAARAQSRRHFPGKQSDGIEHAVDRDLAAHVRFHDDASQAKLITQLPQPRKHYVRCTIGHPILQ